MIRIDLIPIEQKGEIFWILKYDPRKIVKLLPDTKAGEEQDDQRPWIKKKVQEISSYVGGNIKFQGANLTCKGLLPSAPVLDIISPLKVEEDKVGGVYYINLPVTEKEFEMYKGCIFPIDGQHRLRAFMEVFLGVGIEDREVYDMVFFIFNSLNQKDKRELFLITNEKHDNISKNLLMKMKKWLGLLEEIDDTIFDIVVKLNSENISPLKDKIIIGEEKRKHCWKVAPVSMIINKSHTFNTLNAKDEDTIVKIISNYLKAWQNVYGFNIITDTKSIVSKISGFRYIMYYFPSIYNVLKNAKIIASVGNFEQYVAYTKEVTNMKSVFETEKNAFKGEGATLSLVQEHIVKYNKLIEEKLLTFDPSIGI